MGVLGCSGSNSSVPVTPSEAAAPKDENEKEKAIKSEQEKLQGRWRLMDVEVNGQKEETPAKLDIVISGDVWTIDDPQIEKFGGNARFTIKIDPSQNPKAIDFISARSGVVDKRIYKLDKDVLTICTAQCLKFDETKRRPVEFKTDAGGVIHVYKRE
jgi:uncharacterized protein (TIGR03067 family)